MAAAASPAIPPQSPIGSAPRVIALTVDSFGPRGIASAGGRGLAAQAFDAYAALHYLALAGLALE